MSYDPTQLARGMIVWVDLDPARGREQAGRRPALVVASDLFLEQANTLAIIVPASSVNRGWPNHVLLQGDNLELDKPTFAMTEQPRTISRERIVSVAGQVDAETMRHVDQWLRDFLGLH